jgi:hypothetical protein
MALFTGNTPPGQQRQQSPFMPQAQGMNPFSPADSMQVFSGLPAMTAMPASMEMRPSGGPQMMQHNTRTRMGPQPFRGMPRGNYGV